MTRPVTFRPAAAADIARAHARYDGERPGVGYEFLRDVADAVRRAAGAAAGVSRLPLRRFPYGVYCVAAADRVAVVAVYRDPRGWRERTNLAG